MDEDKQELPGPERRDQQDAQSQYKTGEYDLVKVRQNGSYL